MTNLLDRIEDKVRLLPEGLQNHIQRTRIKAKEISNIHGIDEIKCELGVLSHDLARHFNKEHLEDESKIYMMSQRYHHTRKKNGWRFFEFEVY